MTARRRKPGTGGASGGGPAPQPDSGARVGESATSDAEREASFAERMAEDAAIAEAGESHTRTTRAPRVRRRAPARTASAAPLQFTRPDPGEALLGHVAGVQRRVLRQLRNGRPSPQLDIDLHGLNAREAKAELRRELEEAANAGVRCVRVIHGRGLGSAPEKGAVLKRRLPEWLAEPTIGEAVLAFAPAPPSAGGSGATLLLLRAR